MKKKLLVVVGAGASIEYGMPSVREVNDLLIHEAQKRYPFKADPSNNLYKWISHEVTAYWSESVKPSLSKIPNYEDILYVLYLLTAAYPNGVFTSPLGAFISGIKPIPDINWFCKQKRSVGKSQIVWRELSEFLSDTIINHFRNKCNQLESTHKKELDETKIFFKKLSKCFQISIVTLNYDDIIYRSTLDLNLVNGFDSTGLFKDELIFDRTNWPCILHLHGSVHFDMRLTLQDMHNIRWQSDLKATFNQNSTGRGGIETSEGTAFPNSVIVAGYGKTLQILRRPFRTYYSELDRLVSQSDALLCMGYGFGDDHINTAIETYRDNCRQRPVVLIDCAEDQAMSASHAHFDENRTISKALEVLKTSADSMKANGYSHPCNVEELKASKLFDLSDEKHTPLALWYNGMHAACLNPDLVLAHLSQ